MSFKIKKSSLLAIFIIIALTTEFYLIEVFGGALRVSHFLAPIVVVFLIKYIGLLRRTVLFWMLVGFFIINFIAALMATDVQGSLFSLGLLAANMLFAFAVGLILASKYVSLEGVIKIFMYVAIVGIFLGITQVVIYKLIGINLGFSESQVIQIQGGFSPGFKYEANGFAKFLNFAFLLIFPTLMRFENKRYMILMISIFSIGMLTSFTRSAMYGLGVTVLILYLRYFLSKGSLVINKRYILVLICIVLVVFIFSIYVINFNEYAAYKILSFFDKDEILNGSSSSFRLKSQQYLLDAYLATDKTVLLGTGWGQVKYFAYGRWFHASGADILLTLTYGGLFGGLFYLLYTFVAINSVKICINKEKNAIQKKYLEGLMFSLLCAFITGQINGAMIASEYWILFGLAMGVAALNNEKIELSFNVDKN